MYECEKPFRPRTRLARMLCLALGVSIVPPAAVAQDLSVPAEPDVSIDFSDPPADDFLDGGPATGEIVPAPAPKPRQEAGRHGTRPADRSRERNDENGGGWYARTEHPERVERRGSFSVVTFRSRRSAVPDITLVPPGATFIEEGAATQREGVAAGPQVIDVDAARLDRRGYGPDGLDVSYSGGAKIIRISPDFAPGSN